MKGLRDKGKEEKTRIKHQKLRNFHRSVHATLGKRNERMTTIL